MFTVQVNPVTQVAENPIARFAQTMSVRARKIKHLVAAVLTRITVVRHLSAAILVGAVLGCSNTDTLKEEFQTPPDSAQPGVYWYFMDGNLDRGEMVADLESMKAVGLGNLVFLEVDVGVPRGPVSFMSADWQELYANAVHHAERLGIDITLGAGPGWTGSGGPWVPAEQSMQHLVFSTVETSGPATFDAQLPAPAQRSTTWHQKSDPYYEDVVLFAFPRREPVIENINEKALFERDPYTSHEGVKPFLPAPGSYPLYGPDGVIKADDIRDLTHLLNDDGRLRWGVPPGAWTILRMGRRSTGASTRPAPAPGVGFDHDKFDKAALENHFDNYYGKLIGKVGPRAERHGWTTVHLDSWEMGAQNWTPTFRTEFEQRRGYDPFPYVVTFSGRIVESLEVSERFLWDVRLTAQELVLENYAGHLKTLGRQNGFELSIEPYDMNPTADLDLGAIADVPMCEFWSVGYGFDSSFSCIEATSIAHTMGRSIVSAEAFTASGDEKWQQYPWSMKNQGDWAFAMGVNRFVYHTFAHKPLGEHYRPGMTMGPYGVHWDRGQTWWPMVKDYHRYVARISHMLRQGVTVSDILYLTPEGAPHVFRPPSDALNGVGPLADKRGFGFDGVSPNILIDRATVVDGDILFDGGTLYRLLVLPQMRTMTPRLLNKISQLVEDGATILGQPPIKSPSLSGYPLVDQEVESLALNLWGSLEPPSDLTERKIGFGQIHWGGAQSDGLYPSYETALLVLKRMGVHEDFSTTGPVRYGHRRTNERDIYFVSNRSGISIETDCVFRIGEGHPELWDPVNGEIRPLPDYSQGAGTTSISISFSPYQSYVVVFPVGNTSGVADSSGGRNFPDFTPVSALRGSWKVAFDPARGGPESVTFDSLADWTLRQERGIKYYSGIAAYRKTFDLPAVSGDRIYLDLGTVHDMAQVRLNGEDLGVIWCAPWQVEITDAVTEIGNDLEIEVVNRWPNRMLGDREAPDAGVRRVNWESGLLAGEEYSAGRYTFSTHSGPDTLLPSGLLGPVRVLVSK